MRTCLAVLALAALVRADPLAEIARSVDGKARRASSGVYDPESNIDAYHIGPGQTETLTELAGPGEIRHIWFTIAGRDRRYPRTAVLRIYWDGAKAPSVETPIGDFFAAGNGMRAEVRSPPVEVTSYGRALNCYWRMPFRSKARIEFANEGKHDLCVYWQIDWLELPRPPDRMLYFHARYRQEFPAKPFSPYVMFDGKGAGHYVGTVFSLQASYGSWFGESDDRFYIDGEEEPSIVGTGTEDYFNDAWNFRLFSNQNTGVTIKEPNAEDCRFTAYRWHIQAPVTFRKSLKVDIERRSYCRVTDPATGEAKDYDFKYRPDFCSSVAYWYQEDIAEPFDRFPAVEERINPEIFLEVADMAPEIRTSSGVRASRRSNRVCNQKQMLLVENGGPGGWFEVPCTVEREGKYSISIFQCLFRSNGIWKVTLRGPAGEIVLARALDFYDPYLAWKENRPENFLYGTWLEEKVGIHRLVPGDYVFRFECAGAHMLSRADGAAGDRPGYNCRLDGISLRKFPWDDLAGMMERYLAEEEKLFAARVAEARSTVARLEAAIERWKGERGAYPPDLAGFDTGRDPWGQRYRYACPGAFNPRRFDVWSVHGNSRSPARWIGNWPLPWRLDGAIEGESLARKARSEGVTVTEQELTLAAAPPLSNGKLLFVRFRKAGDWIDLVLPPALAGRRCRLTARLVTSWDYAIATLSLNGKALGEPVDLFTPKIGLKAVACGTVELAAGENVLRVQVTGRGERSAGFSAGLDAIVLETASD